MGILAKTQGAKLTGVPEQLAFTYTQKFSVSGIFFSAWTWLGENQAQISLCFGFICTLLAIISFIKGMNRK